MFINLIYSYDHLQNFGLSSFENFYTHLGTSCDLAEEFLLKAFLLIRECTDQKSSVLQELTKEDFLTIAENWYDNNYKKVYAHYLNKGKPQPMKLPSRANVLDEYFDKELCWKQYKNFSQRIREYRNVIVHDIQIARIISYTSGMALVPKKEKIQLYKKWSAVFSAQNDIKRVKNDFINMKEQMVMDIGTLENILNEMWVKPLNDLKKLVYEDKNEKLLDKYNLDLA